MTVGCKVGVDPPNKVVVIFVRMNEDIVSGEYKTCLIVLKPSLMKYIQIFKIKEAINVISNENMPTVIIMGRPMAERGIEQRTDPAATERNQRPVSLYRNWSDAAGFWSISGWQISKSFVGSGG